jgi:hypothetical protein
MKDSTTEIIPYVRIWLRIHKPEIKFHTNFLCIVTYIIPLPFIARRCSVISRKSRDSFRPDNIMSDALSSPLGYVERFCSSTVECCFNFPIEDKRDTQTSTIDADRLKPLWNVKQKFAAKQN